MATKLSQVASIRSKNTYLFPEKNVILTKLKLLKLMLFSENNPHRIHCCIHPTCTTTFLICNWFYLRINLKQRKSQKFKKKKEYVSNF